MSIFVTVLYIVVVIGIGLMSVDSLKYLRTKGTHIAYDLMPVSMVEKYLLIIMRSVVVPLAFIYLSHFLVDAFFSLYAGTWIFPHICEAIYTGNCYGWMFDGTEISKMLSLDTLSLHLFIDIVFVHAWLIFCATLFKRYPFVTGFILWGIFCKVLQGIYFFVFKGILGYDLLDFMQNWYIFNTLVHLSLAIIFYVWGYIRIKRSHL